MTANRSLGDRMKDYEELGNIKLMKRLPVMLRIDGWKFSKYTKRLKIEKPFDKMFSKAMTATAIDVAQRIQGCVFGYTQSDEISLVIRTDQSDETTPWFDNRIAKMASVSASFATVAFNDCMRAFYSSHETPAFFDCRPFALPSNIEVMNCLIFRQRDCVRNSISNALYYDGGKVKGRGTIRKMAHGKNRDEQQELLYQTAGINWAKHYPEEYKNGIAIFREAVEVETENGKAIRNRWKSSPAPIFTSDEGREWLMGIIDPPKEDDEEGNRESV